METNNSTPTGERTAKKIVEKIISAIEPLKVSPAKTKPEKFVNVGIEATKRLLTDNKQLICSLIEDLADTRASPLPHHLNRG